MIAVTGDDPDCLHTGYGKADTITIHFNRDTDQPTVTTKADIDKILVFSPPIGTDYSGYWETPSKLVLRIESIRAEVTAATQFSYSFTPNYLDNNTVFNESIPDLPTTRFQCYGINICGMGGPTIGICSENGLSCRAYEGSTFTIDFDDGVKCEATGDNRDWLWVLLAVFNLIVAVIFFLTGYYCYRKNKQKRQKVEALRVVERWQRAKGKDSTKEETVAPWAKPPDVFKMRDQPDPFSEGPLKNLPEMAKRPPTAAAGENLPPLDTIPTSFVPRAGARIAPNLPLFQPMGLKGPLYIYAQQVGPSLHLLNPYQVEVFWVLYVLPPYPLFRFLELSLQGYPIGSQVCNHRLFQVSQELPPHRLIPSQTRSRLLHLLMRTLPVQVMLKWKVLPLLMEEGLSLYLDKYQCPYQSRLCLVYQ